MTHTHKKIIFVGHSGYQYPHTRVRCYNFAQKLKTEGFTTEVLSFCDHLAQGRTEEDMYFSLRDRDKLALILKGLRRVWKERGALLYLQKIHFHAAVPYLLRWMGRNEYILDYDDYDVPLSNFCGRGRYNRLLFGSADWQVITEKVIRRAKACVASSHALVEFLSQYHDQVWYIPTGVDTSLFYPAQPSEQQDRVVLFWNGIVWGDPIIENLLFILEVFQQAHALVPELVLRIQGGGREWARLQNLVQARYGSLPVELCDWVDPAQMPDLLRQVHIGLLPLVQKDEWTKAKSPTKLFEYLASGLAVVAHTTGEVNHVVSHQQNGWLAPDQASFREGIIELATNARLRRQLGQAARKRVEEQFSLAYLGGELARLLDSVGVSPILSGSEC